MERNYDKMELIYESVEECIQAELEIRSMERLQAQKRKMNPEAAFTDLPLDLFKRICSFKEQDWKIYSDIEFSVSITQKGWLKKKVTNK